MTDAEHAELAGFADGHGLSLPRFLVEFSRLAVVAPEDLPGAQLGGAHDPRRCAVERRQISAVFTRVSAATRMLGTAVQQLRGAATNLNQTTAEMHRFKHADQLDDLAAAVEEIAGIAPDLARLATEANEYGKVLAREAWAATSTLAGPAKAEEAAREIVGRWGQQ